MPRWLKFNPQRLPKVPRSSCFQERTCVSTTSPLKTKVCEIEEWGCWEHLERTKGSVSKPKWNTAGLQLCYLLHRTRSLVTKQNQVFCDRLHEVRNSQPPGQATSYKLPVFSFDPCAVDTGVPLIKEVYCYKFIWYTFLLCFSVYVCVVVVKGPRESVVTSHIDMGSLVHHCVCQAHWPTILLCRLSPHHRNM